MADVGEEEEPRSRLEDIKYYTSLFLGSLAIIALFAFLFLVPFVLDPAISTMFHQQEINYGLTNCSWSSCREGCTAEFFKCHQIRVTYTPEVDWRPGTMIQDLDPEDWAQLDRTERPVDPDTGQPAPELEYVVTDTPFLVNIKGCGYPPDIVCDLFAEKYDNHSQAGETFPCHYSTYNPWMVIAHFNRDETMSAIMTSIFIPNIIFLVSVSILVYWYCPYCDAKYRGYSDHENESSLFG